MIKGQVGYAVVDVYNGDDPVFDSTIKDECIRFLHNQKHDPKYDLFHAIGKYGGKLETTSPVSYRCPFCRKADRVRGPLVLYSTNDIRIAA